MKRQFYLVIFMLIGAASCTESQPTLMDHIEEAISDKFPTDSIQEVVLIDSVLTTTLEETKTSLEGAVESNRALIEEIKALHIRIFDLDIEMQLSSGAEKEQFKLEMEAEEAKMEAYTYSIDQLDSISAIHNEDLEFIHSVLNTHRMNDHIGYYHVSALVGDEQKYFAIAQVASDLWEVFGVFEEPLRF